MPDINQVQQFLDEFAPLRLAAEWDNVGLLLGDRTRPAARIMTSLTITVESAAEAVRERAELIVTHHPFPFHAAKQWTTDTPEGRLLLTLVEAKIAVLSPHTAFDSAARGINQTLAEKMGFTRITPLIPDGLDAQIGAGRRGELPSELTLAEFAERVCAALGIGTLQLSGSPTSKVRRVAIACGAAGELLTAAIEAECDCFLTGEARFHTALAAQAAGIALVLTGHYASERFAVEELANVLSQAFPDAKVWPSRDESDPLLFWPTR